MAHTPEEQAQVIIDFGRGADGASRIARVDLLLYCYGRRESEYGVAFGLGHLAHKLACVAAEALDVASLSLGIEGVKRERRFARTRHAGDDHEAAAGYVYVDVFEIVYLGSAHGDIL